MGTDALVTQRQLNLHIAEQIAPGWERRRPEIEAAATPVRRWMVQALASRPGETVLELAAGMGDTGYEVARRLGEHGHLITSDFSAAMLAGRAGAAPNSASTTPSTASSTPSTSTWTTTRSMRCSAGSRSCSCPIPVPPCPRLAGCCGRAVVSPWPCGAAPERNPFFTAIVGALVRHGHLPPPPPDAPGVFALADETRLRAALRAAGSPTSRPTRSPACSRSSTMGAYIGLVADTAGPIGLTIQALPEDAREAIGRECEAMLEPFAVDTGYDIPSLALCAVAR